MQWDESLSIGIGLIDAQHREWIQRLNDVSAAMHSTKETKRLVETMEFLRDYTRFHFETEERCMADHKYPELDDHRKKHQELTQTLTRLEDDFDEEGITPALTEAVNTLLGNWLIQHIREVDQRFSKFLKDRGLEIRDE
jgi:hemerythrin